MKLSERFNRRYQPAAIGEAAPVAVESTRPAAAEPLAPTAPDGSASAAGPLLSARAPLPTLPEPSATQLGVELTNAKTEIHAMLLERHAGEIDINNRAGLRRILGQLTAEHYRTKPPTRV